MKTILLFIFLYGFVVTIPNHYTCMKKIEKNGMSIQWKHQGNSIDFEVFAPTKGWVAIGFNQKNQLPGTNLIMGAVAGGQTLMSDRYIVGIGDHQAVEILGGSSHLSNIQGKETAKGTTLSFSISAKALDKFHWNLLEKEAFSLLIAYSQSDDFMHHSRMRTAVEIEL